MGIRSGSRGPQDGAGGRGITQYGHFCELRAARVTRDRRASEAAGDSNVDKQKICESSGE